MCCFLVDFFFVVFFKVVKLNALINFDKCSRNVVIHQRVQHREEQCPLFSKYTVMVSVLLSKGSVSQKKKGEKKERFSGPTWCLAVS